MNEEVISESFGCKIVKRKDKLFIQYDNGQSVSWIVENEITFAEAEKAKVSEKDAYEVILRAEKRNKPLKII